MVFLTAIPTMVSVALEWLGIIDPTNIGRALCALPFGAATAWIFVESLRAEARQGRIPDPGVRIGFVDNGLPRRSASTKAGMRYHQEGK